MPPWRDETTVVNQDPQVPKRTFGVRDGVGRALVSMGKGEKAKLAKPAEARPPRQAWISARSRRKYTKWLCWLLGPLLAAAAVAYLGAPEQAPSAPDASPFGSESSGGAAGETLDAPPVDTWSNPSDCTAWAGGGECKRNAEFMEKNCAFSCAKLIYAQQRYEKRCPKPDNYTAALPPGRMHEVFARALNEFPELQPEMISTDPPVIIFHNFLSDAVSLLRPNPNPPQAHHRRV